VKALTQRMTNAAARVSLRVRNLTRKPVQNRRQILQEVSSAGHDVLIRAHCHALDIHYRSAQEARKDLEQCWNLPTMVSMA
jgi:hypothetical protein